MEDRPLAAGRGPRLSVGQPAFWSVEGTL
jgi:hypothetical protein